MTSPLQPTDTLAALISERVGAATVDLATLLAKVRERLAKLALDPANLQGPELNAIVDQVLAEMRRTARAAASQGADRDDTRAVLADKTERLTTLAKVLATTTRPSLPKAFAMISAADAFVVGVAGVISDKIVGASTFDVRAKVSPNRVAMWVPERDACARCLRYAGLRILRAGDQFPAGLSYDPAQQNTDAGTILGPPLHPHCRCELQLVAKGDSEDASQALEREAQRAVLKGWALESEGNASRERAARALLATGAKLVPVSVRREAAKRLGERGTFTRDVPNGHVTPAEKAFLRSYSGVYR